MKEQNEQTNTDDVRAQRVAALYAELDALLKDYTRNKARIERVRLALREAGETNV